MKNRLFAFNTLHKMRRAYKRGEKRLDYLPLRLWVELTNNCNLRCTMCPNSMSRKIERGLMSMDVFKEVVDQTKEYVTDMNLSHRGESLLHPDLPEMIRYARINGIATRLNTNATLLTPEISRELIEAGLDFISFSFDGIDSEKYELMRVNASYDITLNNILKFLETKKITHCIVPYVMLEVLDVDNLGSDSKGIADFMSKFRHLPLNKLTIKPLHNWGGQYDKGVAHEDSNVSGMAYSPCTNIWYSMVVLYDGSITLCCQDWYNENSLGNIRDSSIESMWNGEVIVSVRDLLAKKQFNQIEICSHCDLLWRPTTGGVPNVNLIGFLSENLLGYGRLRQFISPLEKLMERRERFSSRKVIK